MSQDKDQNNYDADSIKVLKGLEAVQVNPGMYIGNVHDKSGLHQMLYEVIDNSIDEVLAGYAKKVSVDIYEDGSISVQDDGRGIPVDIHKEENISAAELIMTRLHAGGKFNKTEDSKSYKVSGGLHGVGVSVVNALSSWLELDIYRNGKKYHARFEEGNIVNSLKEIEKSETNKTGTLVRFLPSKKIFSVTNFEFEILEERLKELAFLNRGVYISLKDHREEGKKQTLHYTGGIEEYVAYLNNAKHNISPIIYFSNLNKGFDITAEIAMQWNSSYHENFICFTNNIRQKDGGTHLSGFKTGLTKALLSYISAYSILKKNDVTITGDDIREGLTYVISIKLSTPSFSSQTKDKLVTEKVKNVIDKLVLEAFAIWLEKNSSEAKIIIEKIKEAARARLASKKARDLSRKKNIASFTTLPGKLADCQEKDPSKSEVFIVEGDSAGGTTKQGRNRKFQAVLPIRGKILNVEKARFHKIFESEQIKILIAALGAGIGKEDFNIEKLRYHKIIIMTDADVDGAHIRTLLLTFFFRNMSEIIEKGYLYIAQPPLYQIKQQGEKERYIKDEKELQQYLINRGSQICSIKIDNSTASQNEFKNFLQDINSFMEMSKKINLPLSIIEILGISFAKFGLNEEASNNFQVFFKFLQQESKQLSWNVEFDKDESILTFSKNFDSVVRIEKIYLNDISNGYINKVIKKFSKIFQLFTKAICILVEEEKISKNFNTPSEVLNWVHNFSYNKLRKVQRFKGLGEMNSDQLRDTTLDINARTLLKVNINDAIKANDIFSTLMGDAVEPRRNFIQKNALSASNIDI